MKKSFRRRVSRKPRYKKKYSLAKKLLSLNETKAFPYDAAVTVKHLEVWTWSPSQSIVVGTNSEQRIGDKIFLKSLTLTGYWGASSVSTACTKLRVIVHMNSQNVSCPTQTLGALTGTQMWYPNTSAIPANGIINPNATSVLADFIIDVNSSISTAQDLKSFNVVIPLNKMFPYALLSGVYGKVKNLYVTTTALINGGTPGVTVAGTLQVSSILKFKDP